MRERRIRREARPHPARPRQGAASSAAPARPRTPGRPAFHRLEELPPPVAPKPRPTRPVPPLPGGPLLVPISTVDWLVSRERPAARYVALRDLLERPPKDLELRKARQALRMDPTLRDALPRLRRRLAPNANEGDLERKYDGGYWQALFLVEMGCDRSLPEIRHAGDVLFARFERALVEIERGEAPEADLRSLPVACRILALMGHAEDPRVLTAAGHLARKRIAQTEPGEPAAKDLLLFTAIPEAVRPDDVRRGVEFLVERALATELPRDAAQGREARLGFPAGDEPDLLELLDALTRAGVARRPEVEPALAIVASRADRRARWTLERSLPGASPFGAEREGELSRWVTIRALRVMQHFLGLSVVGAV